MKYKLHIKNKLIRLLLIVQTVMLWQLPVYAKGGLLKNKLYTGTVDILNDSKKILLTVEVVLAAVLLIKEGMKRQSANDPTEQAQHAKNMKNIVKIAVIVTCASALIPTILAYYQ